MFSDSPSTLKPRGSLNSNGMSYNVATCTPPVPDDDDAAWRAVDTLINAKGGVPPVFRELHDQLTASYPCISHYLTIKWMMVFGAMDLCGTISVTALPCSALTWSRVEEVLPFLIRTASGLGLTVFDWGGPAIYRPAPAPPPS